MNAELIAENRPAWMPPGSLFGRGLNPDATHEDKRCVQVPVVLLGIFTVKLSGFPAVYGEEVGTRVIGPEWIEEFFEDRLKATAWGDHRYPSNDGIRCGDHLDRAGLSQALM